MFSVPKNRIGESHSESPIPNRNRIESNRIPNRLSSTHQRCLEVPRSAWICLEVPKATCTMKKIMSERIITLIIALMIALMITLMIIALMIVLMIIALMIVLMITLMLLLLNESDSESPKQHPPDGYSLCLELIISDVAAGKDGHGGA